MPSRRGCRTAARIRLHRRDEALERDRSRAKSTAFRKPSAWTFKAWPSRSSRPMPRASPTPCRPTRRPARSSIAIDSDIEPKSAEAARSAYIGTNNVKAGEAAGNAAKTLRPKGVRSRFSWVPRGPPTPASTGKASSREPVRRSRSWRRWTTTAITPVLGTTRANGPLQVQRPRRPPRTMVVQRTGDCRGSGQVSRCAQADHGRHVRPRRAAVGELEKGHIDASVCQSPYEMGFQGVKLLNALIQKDDKAAKEVLPDGKSRDTGVRVIVPKADSPVKGRTSSRSKR